MENHPKILIGTLYSGESQMEESKKSLHEQNYKKWSHKVFRNLPNKEAHEALYKYFMKESRNFDIFLKLDADMILKSESSLENLAKIVIENPNVDHFVTPVRDWYSDSLITGIHFFRNSVEWVLEKESVFVDPDPKSHKKEFFNVVLADHSPEPTLEQAYHFGIQKALKTFQFDRKTKSLSAMIKNKEFMKKVWRNFVEKKEKAMGIALLGFEDCARQRQLLDYKSAKIPKSYKGLSTKRIYEILKRRWGRPYYLEFWFSFISPFYSFLSLFGEKKLKKLKRVLIKNEK